MRYATATFDGVSAFGGRSNAFSYRSTVRAAGSSVVMGFGALAAVGLLGGAVLVASAWIVNTALVTNPNSQARTFTGPGTLALAGSDRQLAMAADTTFESKWARVSGGNVALLAVPDEPAKPVIAKAAEPIHVAKLASPTPVNVVPLPRPHPTEIARAPVIPIAPQIVAATAKPTATTVETRIAALEPNNKAALPPELDSRTAVYDISARTVFLPSGEKLEAHSGLYEKMDDPRYIHVRMRGPTPPNVYDLTLREELFHGVRAIRLNPVDDRKMFGRDGMLAHTYMLGPNGQSNGCVSFKNYDRFLQAFLRGEVDRLVVVPEGGTKLALAVRTRRGQADRYAANNAPAGPNRNTW